MHRWFVAFTFRKNPEAAIQFENLVCSTPDKLFCFALVAQRIANDHQYSDVKIINWKLMEELEFMAYEGWRDDQIPVSEREVEEFEGRI
jgi:hypothetical protein